MDGPELILPGPTDPLAVLDLIEDFCSGAATAGSVGVLGWFHAGGSASSTSPETGHPGVFRRDTSSTSGTIAYTRLLISTNNNPILASDFFTLTWVFRLNTNDANTKVRLGLSSDFTSDAPANAIYLEKVDADTSWFACVRASSVQSRSAAIAAVDTGWHKLVIRRIDASTVGFTLDGAAEVTLNTNVPTVGVQPGTQITNSAAASKTLDHDFFRLTVPNMGR